LISVHALFLAINHFIICIQHDWKETTYTPPATVVFLIFLIFESLLFAIFTAVMLGTHYKLFGMMKRVLNNLKKSKRDGKRNLNGRVCKLYSEDFQLVGWVLLQNLRYLLDKSILTCQFKNREEINYIRI